VHIIVGFIHWKKTAVTSVVVGRVTRLGEFLPIGRIFAYILGKFSPIGRLLDLGSFLKSTEVAHILGSLFDVKNMYSF
jgi:hypothetical protein